MPAIVQTVFILDDDVSFCRALERLLRALGYRVQAFQSAFEFFAHWSPEQAGCLLLDLRMPDLNGLEVQRRLAGLEPELPIIFVSGQADVPSCVSAMRNGATDILLKPFQEEELVEALTGALARDLLRRQSRVEQAELRARLATLTPRELGVFRLVAKGILNKQIAAVLGTKEGTVKMHRGHVMRKLGLGSVAELVSYADRLKLDDPCPGMHALAGRFRNGHPISSAEV
jgi:FixJ family two-component response regulator